MLIRRLGTAAAAALVLLGGFEQRFAAQPDAAPVEVTVYAAASLREALQELAPPCGTAHGVRLVFSFGASNDLARQIQAGGAADLFFSADEAWMDAVDREGLVDRPSRKSLLSNRLVVVAPSDSRLLIRGPADLAVPEVRRLSLANPEAVPAGKYAKAWLEKAGIWQALADRVVPGLDVRAALAAVESGAIEAGVVYRTDAAISKKVRVVYEVPAADGPRISYPLAALTNSRRIDLARHVVGCLAGAEAAVVFKRLGFVVLSQGK